MEKPPLQLASWNLVRFQTIGEWFCRKNWIALQLDGATSQTAILSDGTFLLLNMFARVTTVTYSLLSFPVLCFFTRLLFISLMSLKNDGTAPLDLWHQPSVAHSSSNIHPFSNTCNNFFKIKSCFSFIKCHPLYIYFAKKYVALECFYNVKNIPSMYLFPSQRGHSLVTTLWSHISVYAHSPSLFFCCFCLFLFRDCKKMPLNMFNKRLEIKKD